MCLEIFLFPTFPARVGVDGQTDPRSAEVCQKCQNSCNMFCGLSSTPVDAFHLEATKPAGFSLKLPYAVTDQCGPYRAVLPCHGWKRRLLRSLWVEHSSRFTEVLDPESSQMGCLRRAVQGRVQHWCHPVQVDSRLCLPQAIRHPFSAFTSSRLLLLVSHSHQATIS